MEHCSQGENQEDLQKMCPPVELSSHGGQSQGGPRHVAVQDRTDGPCWPDGTARTFEQDKRSEGNRTKMIGLMERCVEC